MEETPKTNYTQHHTIFGDQNLNQVIGNKKVIIQYLNDLKLLPDDIKKFGGIVRPDKIFEFKNLLNRIIIDCDISQFDKAQKFIDEANTICHHYHVLLSYNGPLKITRQFCRFDIVF